MIIIDRLSIIRDHIKNKDATVDRGKSDCIHIMFLGQPHNSYVVPIIFYKTSPLGKNKLYILKNIMSWLTAR